MTPDARLLGRVSVPTLVLWGADDPFDGVEVGVRLVRELPAARLEVLPDAGHLPWLDNPAHVGQSVVSFLHHSMAKR